MKKYFLILLTVLLMGSFISGMGVQSALAKEKPKYGGVLKLNFFRPASRIGVPLNIRHSDHWYSEHALQKLIEGAEDQAGAYVGILATSWDLAPDRKSYTFHLRKGVKFHDGTDFNAQVVKWNLDKVLASKRPQFDKVTGIDIIDDHTIRFNLSEWDNLFIGDFSSDPGFIISPASFEKKGEKWANTNPVGTGPWKIKKIKRNTMISFEKYKGYWEAGVPYLDELLVYHIPDSMTAMAAFKNKDIDILYSTDPITADELESTGNYIVQIGSGPSGTLVMNTTDPKSVWYDKRMRYAFEYAIDKELMAKSIGRGYLKPSYEIVKAIHDAGGKPGTVPRKYNLEKAKQLMREAGYPNGVKVTLTTNADGPQDGNVALQGFLSAVGIQIKFNKVRGATLNQMSFKPPLGSDIRAEAQRGGPGNPLHGVKEVLSETSIYLPGLKRPDGFQELLEEALQKEDPKEVMPLLEKMEKLAYDEAMFVPMLTGAFLHVIQPYVKNPILIYGGGPHPKLQYTWIDKK
ncbi:MAG: ABC transporter substrate-binding protein [Deltaproteobacteria bacterium]|nr:ABC transporter substrate-binding protein [Deltaproteobacteria bacterium]